MHISLAQLSQVYRLFRRRSSPSFGYYHRRICRVRWVLLRREFVASTRRESARSFPLHVYIYKTFAVHYKILACLVYRKFAHHQLSCITAMLAFIQDKVLSIKIFIFVKNWPLYETKIGMSRITASKMYVIRSLLEYWRSVWKEKGCG